MKATAKLLATALAAAGLMAAGFAAGDAQAASHGGGHVSASVSHGSWHGGYSGGYSRPAAFRGGYGWRGGYRGFRPSYGFYFGLPIAWGPWWGYDGYYPYYGYPRETVVYRDIVTEPDLVDGGREPMTMDPQVAGVMAPPASGNPLGMHYCASAKAYYPGVKICPEGWTVSPPTR